MAKPGADGGYYAIKGFLYQFDATILEAFERPGTKVGFERVQDIDAEEFVLQVKHREASDYSPSKIRAPVLQLVGEHEKYTDRQLILHAHFRDRAPQAVQFSDAELQEILGTETWEGIDPATRKSFAEALTVRFSPDFEAQHERAIEAICASCNVTTDAEARVAHAIILGELLGRARRAVSERVVTATQLIELVRAAGGSLLLTGHRHAMRDEAFERAVRKRLLPTARANLDGFERLIALDVQRGAARSEIISAIRSISDRLFRVGKSPQPFVLLRGLDKDSLNAVKIELLDHGVPFRDGTTFDGDRFRAELLTERTVGDDTHVVKLIDLDVLMRDEFRSHFLEVFDLFVERPLQAHFPKAAVHAIAVNGCAQVRRIFQ